MQVETTKWAQDEGEPVFTAENTHKIVCDPHVNVRVILWLTANTDCFMLYIPGEWAIFANNIFYIIVTALNIFPLIPKT